MTTAIVTGAGQGIGRAIAVRLATDGFDIVAVDLDERSAEAVAAETGGRAVACDVTDTSAVSALVDDLDDVQVLVNNAGIFPPGSLLDVTPEIFRRVMDVNALAPLLMSQAFLPHLERSNGSIVNISSMAGQLPTPGVGIYPASKAALDSLTRSCALEFGPRGVRVNAVAPGSVVTEGTASVSGDAEREERTRGLIPLGRRAVPADIADAVAFLASDRARYCTGQVLLVDGGLSQGTIAFLKAAQGC